MSIKQLKKGKSKGILKEAIVTTIASSGDETMAEEIIGGFSKLPVGQEKFQQLNVLNAYLIALKNTALVKQGIDEIMKFREAIPEQFRNQTDPFIYGVIMQDLLTKKEEALKAEPTNTSLKELVDYIKTKIGDKRGF